MTDRQATMSPPRRPTRSTTGCTLCKTRRKKCDETKPQCLRCLSLGRSCSYDYIEYSDSEGHRIKRTKPAPRSTSELLAKASRNALGANLAFSPTSSITGVPIAPTNSIPAKTWNNEIYTDPDLVRAVGSLPSPSTPPASSQLAPDISSLISSSISPNPFRLPIGIPGEYDTVPSTLGSTSQAVAQDEDEEDEDDPEGVRVLLYMAPTMDKNVKDNSLPFVLHCYSEWALARVFEPLKVVPALREQVVAQFSSEDTRTRTILLANVMIMFAKNLVIDGRGKSILNHLALTVRKNGSAFMATPTSFVLSQDRQNAMRVLDSMLETFSLQTSTQSSALCLQVLDDAAPVFRRACSEPPGHPVNLANILLTPHLNLRHFATIDIMRSVNTGLPTYFRYEVPFSLDLCDQVYQMQDNYGLQWLHGSPDQFILLFGWINSLCETPGASDNTELIAWIEANLPLIKIAINESSDPTLRIGRIVVQECWRIAVRIYLYMVLCKANSRDPRVVRAQKAFMRLVRGVRPARHPDAYLYTPIVVTGVATIDEQDRDTLRRRILNVRECAEKDTAGNDILVMLEDVWSRTRSEGRASATERIGPGIRTKAPPCANLAGTVKESLYPHLKDGL